MTMTLVVRYSDNLVQYVVPDAATIVLAASPAIIGPWLVGDVSASTHAVIPGQTVPGDYAGGIYTYSAGAWALTSAEATRRAATAAANLAAAKSAAIDQIDTDAEMTREVLITPGSGQALVYQAKADEAMRAAVLPDPLDPAQFPMLQSAVASGLAADLRTSQQIVSAQRAAWLSFAIAIETVRLPAKQQVVTASTPAAVAAILAATEAGYAAILQAAASVIAGSGP